MERVKQYRTHIVVGYFAQPFAPFGRVWIGWQSGIVRNRLLLLVMGLVLATTLMIGLGIAASAASTRVTLPQFAADLQPGLPLPGAASCDIEDPGVRYRVYCTVVQADGALVRVVYDRRSKVIRSVSREGAGVTIGDLISRWGHPKTYTDGGGAVQIFWADRSAWFAAPLKPASPVNLIQYYGDESDLPQDRLPWRGFVSADRP